MTKGIISGLNRAVPVDFDKDNKNDEWLIHFKLMLLTVIQVLSIGVGECGVSLKINMPNIEGMGFAIPIDCTRNC